MAVKDRSQVLPTYKQFIVGEIKRFSQKNVIFARAAWDPKIVAYREKYTANAEKAQDKPGFRPEDFALRNAAWHVEELGAAGSSGGFLSKGLYNGTEGWEWKGHVVARMPEGFRFEGKDPAENARMVKEAARLFGADLVGVAELNPAWVYSHVWNLRTKAEESLELPPECRWVVAIALAEDYDLIRRSPDARAGAAVGVGYSRMAFTAGMLGQYIRNLGYRAIAAGNDTALSVPIAVDAGLGEQGRHGLLVTREYGSRVRLCKVITDLPLQPDRPVDLGLQKFCEECARCAEVCPSGAISKGDRGTEPNNISNNPGLRKWMLNAEQCFRYWAAIGMDCCNCRAACPWNKPNVWYHRLAVRMARRGKWARKLLIQMDKRFFAPR